MTAASLVFVALAAAMALATAVFVRWAAESRTGLRASVVLFLLLMMTGMLAGALVYEIAPAPTTAVEGLWLASAVMSGAVVLVFVAFLKDARALSKDLEAPTRPVGRRTVFVASVVGLVLANEFLMGWVLGLATGSLAGPAAGSATSVVSWLSEVVVSPWFVFTMAAEMLATVVLLRRSIPASPLAVLLLQGAIMVLTPPAFGSPAGASLAVVVGSAVMIGLFVLLMESLYRRRSWAPGFATYVGRLLGVYAIMMAGVFLWETYGVLYVLAAAIVLEMIVFFDAIVRPVEFGAEPTFSWANARDWTTAFLVGLFVAELFMGATLAALLTPGVYTPGPGLPLSGPASTVLANAFANGFFFLANTTATTWFLLMMGVEMGTLVVFRLREVRRRDSRVRLGLMLGCYAAFAVFYPSIYYGELAPGALGATAPTTVPVLGWSMGLGSAPVGVAVLGVLLGTYLAFAVASLLFGRRAVCSTFCTGATMYQGSTLDAMKSFNRTSPPARKYLGSRLSGGYVAAAAVAVVALAGTSVASYLDTIGRLNVTFAGVDPSVAFYDASFGIVWYALFVTVPFVGEYNCVTLGWCHTGLFAGAMSRIGFFRLKVRDREVCRRCTTFDCAKSCPIGLTDLPAQLRAKGEFRSSKCCGVGDCAEACPYGNLYLADVRHSVRARWPARHARPTSQLPMAGPVLADYASSK